MRVCLCDQNSILKIEANIDFRPKIDSDQDNQLTMKKKTLISNFMTHFDFIFSSSGFKMKVEAICFVFYFKFHSFLQPHSSNANGTNAGARG